MVAERLAAWHTDPNRPADAGEGELATLTLAGPDGSELVRLGLTGRHLDELRRAAVTAVAGNLRQVQRQARVEKMADVLVGARATHVDVGELIGAAASRAAARLHGPQSLVAGRPGSWEASLLVVWAQVGGTADDTHVEALAELLVAMGQARDDGGDVLSQAMGLAVNRLGSMAAFAAGSRWEDALRNLGGQYANVDDAWT